MGRISAGMESFDYETKKKEPYRFENDAKHCIVMVPDSVKVTTRSVNGRVEIGTHDTTPEGEFFFSQAFFKFLSEK